MKKKTGPGASIGVARAAAELSALAETKRQQVNELCRVSVEKMGFIVLFMSPDFAKAGRRISHPWDCDQWQWSRAKPPFYLVRENQKGSAGAVAPPQEGKR